MLSALVAVAGSLLGVVLGFFAQHLQADLAHRRHLDDLKREAYGELLRAVSASYAQASSGGAPQRMPPSSRRQPLSSSCPAPRSAAPPATW